jgi:hypothetical protein
VKIKGKKKEKEKEEEIREYEIIQQTGKHLNN